jgi:hypothetical protein
LALVVVGIAGLLLASRLSAHDLERTQVVLAFAADGSFVLDVSNDPSWLKLRMESFPGNFIDRVVLWVDGHEVRPTSADYIPPRPETTASDLPPLATYRLRGRMPPDAKTLRWYYGLVIDPYPLTLRRADGRSVTEWIGGDAWSRPLDVSGQFDSPVRVQIERQLPSAIMLGVLAVALWMRLGRIPRVLRGRL